MTLGADELYNYPLSFIYIVQPLATYCVDGACVVQLAAVGNSSIGQMRAIHALYTELLSTAFALNDLPCLAHSNQAFLDQHVPLDQHELSQIPLAGWVRV